MEMQAMSACHLRNAARRIGTDDRGVAALEYGLIAATTLIAIAAALALISPALAGLYARVAAAF
ncbi:hypothetical protein [Falsiroseomonas sp. E2-1-a4]|uniref:hypothetical protein n=1 Tax=Falsiroseomonas sp. E2-1-a4 TaxID=3239299 RepID=UPI003F3CAE3A